MEEIQVWNQTIMFGAIDFWKHKFLLVPIPWLHILKFQGFVEKMLSILTMSWDLRDWIDGGCL